MSEIKRRKLPNEPPEILGRWFTRDGRKLSLSVSNRDPVDIPTGHSIGLSMLVSAQDVVGGEETHIALDFLEEYAMQFDRPWPSVSPIDSPRASGRRWAGTRDAFVEACKELLFFGLPTGTEPTVAAVASDREPNFHLSWASDAEEKPRNAPAIVHTPARDYYSSLAEAAEGRVLVSLLVAQVAQPLRRVSFEALGEETCIPDTLLRDVLVLAAERDLLTLEADMSAQLTPFGEERAKKLKPGGGGHIGFGP